MTQSQLQPSRVGHLSFAGAIVTAASTAAALWNVTVLHPLGTSHSGLSSVSSDQRSGTICINGQTSIKLSIVAIDDWIERCSLLPAGRFTSSPLSIRSVSRCATIGGFVRNDFFLRDETMFRRQCHSETIAALSSASSPRDSAGVRSHLADPFIVSCG